MKTPAAIILCAAAIAITMLAATLFRFTGMGLEPVLQPDVVAEAYWLEAPTSSFQSAAQVQNTALRALAALVSTIVMAAALVALFSFVTLVLTRHTQRKAELATRSALGAAPGALLRELAAPILRLIAAGTLIGLAAGALLTSAAWLTWPAEITRALLPSLRAGLAAGLACATLLFLCTTLALWLFVVKGTLADALRAGERATSTLGEVRVRELLTILQIAASIVLLAVGFVLARDRPGVQSVAAAGVVPGDEALVVVPGTIDASAQSSVDNRVERIEQILRATRAQPGVTAESIASAGALLGVGLSDRLYTECDNCRFSIGYVPVALMEMPMHSVGPGYFTLLGAELLRGRDFTSADRLGSVPVVIVNNAFAERFFANGDALGRVVRLRTGFGDAHRIIGVLADEQRSGVGAPPLTQPVIYFSALQHPPLAFDLVVRAEPSSWQPINLSWLQWGTATPLPAALAGARQPLLYAGRAVRGFAFWCFLLGAYGLHATVMTLVRGRRRDLEIRLALGCTASGLARHVSGYAMRLALIGMLVGVPGALAAQRTLELWLPGARLDARPFLLMAVILLLVTLAAAVQPARAAARISGSALPR